MSMKISGSQIESIKATNQRTGEEVQIDDMYWFEENYVHDFNGERFQNDLVSDSWSFELIIKA